MKNLALFLVILFIATPCLAEKVYVKADATIEKKVSKQAFVVTAKMKADALKLDEITVSEVKYKVKGVSNRTEAKQVIEELLKDESIKEKSARYNELHPSAVELDVIR